MTSPSRPRIEELIVVEGLHDAQIVQVAVDADVWVIGGDRVAKKFLNELVRAADSRGVVILTDPDGPGERIRQRIAAVIPTAKHAFIQKSLALGKGKVGVEHASPAAVRECLLAAKSTVTEELPSAQFSVEDLVEAGLMGNANSSVKRAQIGDLLGIGTGNAKSFLRKLNVLGISRSEWQAALGKINDAG